MGTMSSYLTVLPETSYNFFLNSYIGQMLHVTPSLHAKINSDYTT